MKKYGFKTICRAIFVSSINIYNGYSLDVDENFFNSLHSFCNDLLINDSKKYIDDIDLVIFFKYENKKLKAFESEDTIKNLFNVLEKIHTYEDLIKLYDEVGQEVVDRISNLAMMYLEYMDLMYDTPSSLIKQ